MSSFFKIHITILFLLGAFNTTAQNKKGNDISSNGKLINEVFISDILKENKVALDIKRNIKIFLPPNYGSSLKSYPVVYFLHNIFWNNDRAFEDGKIESLINKAFASGLIKEFIFVVPDYRTVTTGNLYENSPISGKWLDHTTEEIVPFIDKKFRTIPKKESRAVIGEFMGGRGALKLAMTRSDMFNSVYAMHPVATGMGDLPWAYTGIDWKKLYNAKAYPDSSLNGVMQIFLTVSQAFLPNEDRPPLYCDFFMELINGKPIVNLENMQKAKKGFLLDEILYESAGNLKKMKGIALEWGRFDQTFAHVDSNREFSRKLEDLGIEHEAEEYRGSPFDKTWLDDGRFYTRVIPFLSKNLAF